MRKNAFNRFVGWGLPVGIVAVFLFLVPLLTGLEKLFFDDAAFYFYPQQVFLSRSLAQGVFPWWDQHIITGATPFYARMFQTAYHPVNWLFLLIDNIGAGGSYFWLFKAPVTSHFLLAFVFSWLFARRGLRLNEAGSFVFSLAYSLSPTMTYTATNLPEVYMQVWLPLFCLFILKFAEEGNVHHLLAGALVFALGSTAGDVAFVAFLALITGFFGAGLIAAFFLRKNHRAAIRVVTGGAVIFGLGFLLAGVYWANMLEGLRKLGPEAAESVIRFSGPEQSLHPVYLLATLPIPDFFGGVTSRHAWGAAYRMDLTLNDVNLLGGLVAVFIVILGFLAFNLRRREKPDRADGVSPRAFFNIFLAILVLSILIVLGAYTPVLAFLRLFVPPLNMPYPVRFRIIQCFAMAGVLGCSVSHLWEDRAEIKGRWLRYYLGAVAVVGLGAALWPWRIDGELFMPGLSHLFALGDGFWFLRGPVLYAVAAGVLLLLILRRLKPGMVVPALVCLWMAEMLFFAYPAFYRNRVLNRRIEDISAVRYRGPSDHPVYRLFGELNEAVGGEGRSYRRAYPRSGFDNLAWYDGSLSAFGFDLNPIGDEHRAIIDELTTGFPYELWPRRLERRFWRNSSVRYALVDRRPQLPWSRLVSVVGPFYLVEFQDAFPRLYFQDRWVAAEDDAQFKALVEYDLRAAGYVPDRDWSIRRDFRQVPDPVPLEEEEWIEHFNHLQEMNRVVGADFSNPNRVSLKVRVETPAMLVMTDAWHRDWRVLLDGAGEKLNRVNFVQRGVWCPEGEYEIVMEFLPSSLRLGLALTAFGAVGVIALAAVGFRNRSPES